MKRPIALVGLGKIARDRHVPALLKSPDFELTAIVSGSGGTVAGLPTFGSDTELYASGVPCEAVTLCTPPSVRGHLVRNALRAGKAVVMEKPPTPTLSELEDLAQLAAACRRTLFASWHCQHNPSIAIVRRLLRDEGVRTVRVTWREDVEHWHPGQTWVFDPGNFGVFDAGINALSILTAILPGRPIVREAELLFPSNQQGPIAASVRFELADTDVEAFEAEFDWRAKDNPAARIDIGTRTGRSIAISSGGGQLVVDGEVLQALPKFEYEDIYRRFADLLASDASLIDASPLRLVADIFVAARRTTTEPFHWST